MSNKDELEKEENTLDNDVIDVETVDEVTDNKEGKENIFMSLYENHKKNLIIGASIVTLVVVCLIGYQTRDRRLDITKYIDFSYSGVEGMGKADYKLDSELLEMDLLKFQKKGQNLISNMQIYDNIYQCTYGHEVIYDKNANFKNGDKIDVIINVNPKCDSVKSSNYTVTVDGLSEGIGISNAEISEKVIVEFQGTSGKGTASIRNLFKEDLSGVNLTVDPATNLSNGDIVEVFFDEYNLEQLAIMGYKITESGRVEIKVDNLLVLPDKTEEIKNINDVTRLLNEKIKSTFDSYYTTGYEVKSKLYFAKFIAPSADVNASRWSADFKDGSLGYIVFETKKNSETQEKYFVGFGNVILDEDNNAQINKLELITKKYDSAYSLESIKKIVEADGFVEQ